MLAMLYLRKESTAEEQSKGFDLLHQSATQGLSDAQFGLALYYESDTMGKKDLEQAQKWMLKAANNGNVSAQHLMGERYYTGSTEHQITKDNNQAYWWFSQAAKQGHAQSQFNVGVMLSLGEGVKVDSAEGAKWYLRSAKQGFVQAQLSYAGRLLAGNGLAKNAEEAYFWYLLASKNSKTVTEERLKSYASVLSAAQVDSVQKRVSEWRSTPESALQMLHLMGLGR